MEASTRLGQRRRTASDLKILERLYDVGNQCVRLEGDFQHNLYEILDAAIFVTTADKGKLQLYDADSGGLVLAAQRGFEDAFLDLFSHVRDGSTSPGGTALSSARRVLVEDVTRSEMFSGHPSLNSVLAADVRAVQFTPLVSSTGKVLGMISTHFKQPTRLTDRELRFTDLLARQAADYLERRQNEEALRAKQSQFERVTTPILIIQCSRDLRYVFVSTAYAEFIGRPIDQIVGKQMVEVLGEEVFRIIEPYINRVLAGEHLKYEEQIPYSATRVRYMDIECVPDRDSQGTIVGWIATLSDVTERRLAEQKLRDKDQFLAMLAHELRNPLTPISAGVELLQRTADAQTLEATLSMLGEQVAHMERLLDDLLDVSRVTLGKVELKKNSLDLRVVVERAAQTTHPLIDSMDHLLTLALPQEPIYVRADAVRLTQVLGNLLNNACKYMDRGGSMTLAVERVHDQALVSVRDQGVGFTARDMPRMFELFGQLDTTRDRSAGGLGVGLTLAKRVVEQHGGTLEAHSEGPGQGSEFVIRLPIVPEEPQQREGWQTESDLAVQRRVLIVEDRTEVVEALARLLQARGHITRTANDGAQGVQAAKEFRPEFALVDIGLPNLDGYETCRRIRSEPWSHGMVIIALSGYGQAADVEHAHAAGFDHYLLKPVRYQTLAKVFAREPCGDDKLQPTLGDLS